MKMERTFIEALNLMQSSKKINEKIFFEDYPLEYKDFKICWFIEYWKSWKQEYFISSVFDKKTLEFIKNCISYKFQVPDKALISDYEKFIASIKKMFLSVDLQRFGFIKKDLIDSNIEVSTLDSIFDKEVLSLEIANFQSSIAKKQCKNKEELRQIIQEWKIDLSTIDVGNITDMSYLFQDINLINWDISKWDVKNVTTMSFMFVNSQFNWDISNWDVKNVTNMDCMFVNSQFNWDISNWDVKNVTTMSSMFYNSKFNLDI